MSDLVEIFVSLNSRQKHFAHLGLCRNASSVWQNYGAQFDEISYIEGVVGTHQIVDELLQEAFEAIITGKYSANINWRYAEPITAMHDEDLEFPDNIKFAYYAICNRFNKYILQQNSDFATKHFRLKLIRKVGKII